MAHQENFFGGGFLWMELPSKTLFLSKKKTLSCKQLILDCICPSKELSLWNKIKYLNLNILRTRCCKPLILQIQIIWSNRIHSLKYLRPATFGSKDIVIRKSEFVVKTEFQLFERTRLNPGKIYSLPEFKSLAKFSKIFNE